MAYTINDYKTIVLAEQKMADNPNWEIVPPDEAYSIVYQLEQIIRSSFVLRANSKSPYRNGHLAFIPETVSTHTSIMLKLVDAYLNFTYGPELDRSIIPGGYSYREVMEAITRHDLPENKTGDTPDNNNRNEVEKNRTEAEWWKNYSKYSPKNQEDFDKRVNKLLGEMVNKSSTMGRALFVADKVSAILSSLYLDKYDENPPRMNPRSYQICEHDLREIRVCERRIGKGICRASEMWTVDYLKLRQRVKYDDSGFFTAILVMYTLVVNQTWYTWRECDYLVGPKDSDDINDTEAADGTDNTDATDDSDTPVYVV